MDTRQTLLQTLLHHKEDGLTIDELSARLGISRTAVQQHVSALERDGLLRRLGRRSTGGRPSRAYALSEQGYEAFPRNYDLLAEAMLETASETLGEEAVEVLLSKMADELARTLRPRLQALEPQQRLAAVMQIMNDLGYDASQLEGEEGIAAVNCVYHKLAQRSRAICRYDVRLLSLLLERPIDHTSCMADGDNQCVFRLNATSELREDRAADHGVGASALPGGRAV